MEFVTTETVRGPSSLLAFARTGDPNQSQIRHWPRFEKSQRATLVFDPHTRVESDPHGAVRKLRSDTPMPASASG